MYKEESHTDLGIIRIHKNVVASVAAIAGSEIPGVKKIGRGFKSAILESLGQKFVSTIKVEIDKNEEVSVEIPLVIKYGFNIPEVANKVQENVRTALEKMTNLAVKEINVSVQAIEKE